MRRPCGDGPPTSRPLLRQNSTSSSRRWRGHGAILVIAAAKGGAAGVHCRCAMLPVEQARRAGSYHPQRDRRRVQQNLLCHSARSMPIRGASRDGRTACGYYKELRSDPADPVNVSQPGAVDAAMLRSGRRDEDRSVTIHFGLPGSGACCGASRRNRCIRDRLRRPSCASTICARGNGADSSSRRAPRSGGHRGMFRTEKYRRAARHIRAGDAGGSDAAESAVIADGEC